ncbi:MAG: DnaJ domain-containing protein [Dokdonella sp.]
MSTDALELALALHQAPIQRFTLRDRPLPENIGEALQLASAMQPRLSETAVRFCESEETIVDAVRFYLQQVLFEPGTDAYRVLGLVPTAELSQIRQHHVWLQRWLHPDRRGEDWEASLATKVNWAWSQLRTDAAREKYDGSRLRAPQVIATRDDIGRVVQDRAWKIAAPIEQRPHWLRRGTVGLLAVLGCCVLYLAATRQDRVDPEALAWQSAKSDSSIRARLPFDSDAARTHAREALLAATRAMPSPAASSLPVSVVDEPRTADEISSLSSPGSIAPATAPVTETHSEAPVRAASREEPSAPSPAANLVADSALAPVIPTAPTTVESITPSAKDAVERPTPASLKTSSLETNPPIARQTPRPSVIRESAPAPSARTAEQLVQSPPTSIPIVPPKLQPLQPQRRMAEASPPEQRREQTMPAPARERAEPAAMRVHPEVPDALLDANITEPQSATASSVALPSEHVAKQAPQQSPEELSRETLMRFEIARARVRSMIDYFRNEDARALKGSDDQGRLLMVREGSALRARNGQVATGAFALDPPTWRITHSLVSLQAHYHVDKQNEAAESGQLNLSMAWREGGWQINHMDVAPFQ